MGYNTSTTGVVVQRRATPVCHCIETKKLGGDFEQWVRIPHTGVQTETVTRFSGIADPGTMSGASITMSNTNPPHEATFKGFEAHRISDSNLWEKVQTDRTTTG